MSISQFPSAAGGGGLSNDFILNKNDTTNTTFNLPREFEAGGYSIALSSGDTSYDVYFINADGSAVGYTNGASIVASEAFDTVVVLGVGTAEAVTFTYSGPSVNATAAGNEAGAGPYLTSITPGDLPQIDDTAIVAGGNFASDVQVTFTSGTVELSAKNVVVGSSTALVVTRPDGLIEDLAPYDLIAVNPGVTSPTGSNVNVLSGTVTAGTDPSFVTTSPILGGFTGSAFSSAILTSDSEGTVVDWQVTAGTLPGGIALGSADGVLSGTPSADGEYTFTVQITDDGGNTNSQEFLMPIGAYVSGGSAVNVGGTAYYTFTSSDTLSILNAAGTATLEYVIVAGGGGGSFASFDGTTATGGGGAGGLLWGTASITSDGDLTVTVGAGGANDNNGNDSSIDTIATATAGGKGGGIGGTGSAGGSGGGGGSNGSTNAAGGTGIPGQGNNGQSAQNLGGNPVQVRGGGGGGAGAAGASGNGGIGLDFGAWASAIDLVIDGGYFAGGGGGGRNYGAAGTGGLGGGSNGNTTTAADANSGGGGGGRGRPFGGSGTPSPGGSGVVLVRKL